MTALFLVLLLGVGGTSLGRGRGRGWDWGLGWAGAQPLTEESEATADSRAWCFEMRRDYDIQPGKSFGTLPIKLHRQYLQMRCHRFFCEPHPMAGKGPFDCVPLKGA